MRKPNNQKHKLSKVTVKVTLGDISKKSLFELKRGMAKAIEGDVKLFRRLAKL